MNFTIIELEDIPVMYVKADGVDGAAKAFLKLESELDSLKGKKFYGVFYRNTGEYYSCVKIDENNSDSLFDITTIPGGTQE